jgi:peptidoglycan/LPS O-acetylase OafA/YrhL
MSNKGRGAVQPASYSSKSHRLDIDGLRGIAVAGVVAYHFGLGLPGGYGGVDIFFVISGFLIAGIIKSELERGTFSIANFYVRRIRRILPALTVCLIATSIAAALFLFPDDFKSYGQSLKAAALSVSNFHFMHMKGYFDVEATQKPLLHTWSLGVEEQFYVVFPVMLLLLFKYARTSMLGVLWVVVVASFAYSCFGVATSPDIAFFSTAGRAWELGLGALLAYGAVSAPSTQARAQAEAAIGAALIAICFLFYTDRIGFPGLAALPLCLGAALIIHSGAATTPVASLLSSRPLVGLGLISYSVYLWHWPLLVFGLYRFPSIFSGGSSHPALWLLGLASVVIGALSWAFIEQPFRRMRNLPRATVFVSGGLAVAATFAIAGVVLKHPHRLQHWPQSIEAMQFKKTIPGNRQGLASAEGWPARTYVVGSRGVAADTVLWGDSYGEALIPGFISNYKTTGRGAIIAAKPGCPPVVDVAFRHRRGSSECTHFNSAVFDAILRHNVRRVIFVGFWSAIAKNLVRDSDGTLAVYGGRGQEDGHVFEAELRSMVERLTTHGKEVVFIGPLPEQKFYVAPMVARHIVWNEPLPAERSRVEFLKSKAMIFDIFSRLEKLPHVRVVYPHNYLCDAQGCDYVENNEPLYADDNHLSPRGVARLDGMFSNMFAEATP